MKHNIMRSLNRTNLLAAALFAALTLSARATDRLFTYTYEPETMPQGALEGEQWVTLRAGRNSAVGKDDFYRWQFREELEYGVTDNYQASLYFNHEYETYNTPGGGGFSDYRQTGVSLENKYLLFNPAEHKVGLALYLEPSWDWCEETFKLEEKLIFGQRHGDWKWALNLTHETVWEDEYKETVGEFEATFGIARQLNSHWSIGLEMRHHAEVEEYRDWEGYAFYLGPVVSYHRESWWAAITVMPQVYGANFEGNPDNDTHLDLDGHERVNLRLIFGFSF